MRMMRNRVVVTGMGAITPIGNSVDEFWNGLKEKKVGIGPISVFDTADYKVKLAAEVKDFDPNLIVLALSGGELARAARDMGLGTALEVFADRAYEEDGTLVGRGKPGSMITDEEQAIARVVRMVKEGMVTAVTGKDIPIQADSVCVHGDGEKALAFVERIRRALKKEGVKVCPLRELGL